MIKKIIKTAGMFTLALCLLTAYMLPVYARDMKKLYFEQKNGKMTWNNVRGDDGNWFISFTNMVPGGHYKDQLKIENGCKKTYALYMQVIPLQQDKKKDQLLELISMKVSLGSKTLYKGTASGKKYDHGNLQNVIFLGNYRPGEENLINVELELDKNVGLEYCDLFTRNDWKFMVTETENPENPKSPANPESPGSSQIIHSPKTGDETNTGKYAIIMISACAAAVWVRKKQKAVKNSR